MVVQPTKISIEDFQVQYQVGVENLVLPIQREEFGTDVTLKDQPDLMNVQGFFQKDNGNFWVALDGDRVVGTIGLVDISNKQVAMKKMFVAQEYRGKELAIAQSLLNRAFNWCLQRKVSQIFLGTVADARAAQRFYERNGFITVERKDLPKEFPASRVDTKFYRYHF